MPRLYLSHSETPPRAEITAISRCELSVNRELNAQASLFITSWTSCRLEIVDTLRKMRRFADRCQNDEYMTIVNRIPMILSCSNVEHIEKLYPVFFYQ